MEQFFLVRYRHLALADVFMYVQDVFGHLGNLCLPLLLWIII